MAVEQHKERAGGEENRQKMRMAIEVMEKYSLLCATHIVKHRL
jgi:hypothetical protein